jgi:hypothetical protein
MNRRIQDVGNQKRFAVPEGNREHRDRKGIRDVVDREVR